MRLFDCQNCGQVLFFENQVCGRCGYRLGFLPEQTTLSALAPAGSSWRALAGPERSRRFCANAERDVCNWLILSDSVERFCVACRHNRTVPDLSAPTNLQAWGKMELAKHRLFYTLLRLRLPTPNRLDDPTQGLVFDFLSDSDGPNGARVITGHDNGLITLAVAEADDAEREARRAKMGEPYPIARCSDISGTRLGIFIGICWFAMGTAKPSFGPCSATSVAITAMRCGGITRKARRRNGRMTS